MNIVKEFIYFILSVQEKILTNRLNRTLNTPNTSKHKKYYTHGCLLSLESLAETDRLKMEEEIELILKSSNYNPKEVLEYIKNHGTQIYLTDSEKPLLAVGEELGFIYPQKGAKAIYLSVLTKQKIKLKTDEMFILTKGEINTYYFIYHFYNWYTYKNGVEGIDARARVLLNKFLSNASDEDFSKLQLEDIYALKDAIKQDKAAIDFVIKLCSKYESSKNALNKLKDGGATL